MDDHLPQPRAVLTSLLQGLTSQTAQNPPPPQNSRAASIHPHTQNPNPLKLLPPSSRTLLTTLHVLYPSLLLPALDLLDRRLVTRVLVLDAPSPSADEAEQAQLDAKASSFHLVRSAQQQRRGRRGEDAAGGGGGGLTYVVRAASWSCDCAAFAFGAFPVDGGESSYHISSADDDDDDDAAGKGDENRESRGLRWEFGGLSLDGRAVEEGGVGAGGVPCCKHLLACVLAERWSILGSYVEERQVAREEAAGLIASI